MNFNWNQHTTQRYRGLASPSQLPKTLSTWPQDFLYGLKQLQLAIERLPKNESIQQDEHILNSIMILDQSVGLYMDTTSGCIIGQTLSTSQALTYLPIYIIRRVEYENSARKLNCSEMEIGHLHYPFQQDIWYIGDIPNRSKACYYLIQSIILGNHFAKKVLNWLDPKKGDGILPIQGAGAEEYLKSIKQGNRKRAIELGTMMVTNNCNYEIDARPDETMILKMKYDEKKAMSANNIGQLLAHGRQGILQNINEAIEYYKIAIQYGSVSGLGNLGYIYYSGLGGIQRDGQLAKYYYQQAIEKGERNHVPRNLACLYSQNVPGIKKDYKLAVTYLLLGIRQGDYQARQKCRQTIKKLMTMKFRFSLYIPSDLRKQCIQVINDYDSPDLDSNYNLTGAI